MYRNSELSLHYCVDPKVSLPPDRFLDRSSEVYLDDGLEDSDQPAIGNWDLKVVGSEVQHSGLSWAFDGDVHEPGPPKHKESCKT